MIRKFRIFIENSIFVIFQIISIPLTYFTQIILRPVVEKNSNMVVPPGVLILSNHQSFLDPWIVSYNLGIKNLIFKLFPIRYPVTPVFARKLFLGSLIWCFGGFDIGVTNLEKAKKLLYMRDLIKKKYTVLLFPEGRLVKSEMEKAEFQKGMHLLVSENIPFILVKISGLDNISWINPRKNKVKLVYSNVIKDVDSTEKTRIISEFFE